MGKADFHPVRTRSYTKEWAQKLVESSINTDTNSSYVEIIPYDVLWEMVLEILDNHHIKK